MRHTLITCLALLTASLAQAGTAEVSFVDPQKFSDGGSRLGEAEQVRASISVHLQTLAAAHLPIDQTLRVEVLDLDLAGEVRSTRRGSDMRVLRGRADWPRITLRYSLRQGEKVLAAGEDSLADMNYLDTRVGLLAYNQSLPYERRMLTRWFEQRFVPASH